MWGSIATVSGLVVLCAFMVALTLGVTAPIRARDLADSRDYFTDPSDTGGQSNDHA